jgi:hypothetical protein
VLLASLAAAPLAAQQQPPVKPQPPSPTIQKPAPGKPRPPRQYRGFIALGAGVQAPAGGWSDTVTYTVNVETATTDVDYATNVAPMFDVGAGWRFSKAIGVAVGFSRSSVTSTAQTESEIPHPFFDEQPRQVSGEVGDIERVETAAHVQLFWAREQGKWRTRVLGGVTFFSVDQDLVTRVHVNETYPYDTAEFRSADIEQSSGSGTGFNIGVDVSWMMTRAFGFGGAARYTRGSVDLNSPSGRSVSTDAGGAQGTAGIRIAF